MAVLAIGNRLLWMGRSSSSIAMNATVGSPVLFNAAVVSEGVSIPHRSSTGGVGPQYVGYNHSSALARAWFHWDQAAEAGSTTGSFATQFEIIGVGGLVLADFYVSSGTDIRWRIWNGSTMVQKAGTLPAMAAALTTYDIDFVAGVNGSVTAYRGGTAWFSATWNDGVATQVIGIRMYNYANNSTRTVMSQFAMSDGDDLRGFLVRPVVITGTGNYNQGTGVPADTGDANPTTAKSISVANEQWSGTKPAITLPAGATVDLLAVNLLARAAAPVPNARILVRRGGSDSYDANLSPALAAGYTPRSRVLTVDPTTGLAWDLANINAAEFGLQALA